MTTLGSIFDEEEAAMLARAKAEIAAEALRYEADPVYRAAVDAKRIAAEDILSNIPDDQPEDDEDDEE